MTDPSPEREGLLRECPFCGQEGKALVGPIRDGAAVCCSNFKCLGQVQAFNPNARAKAIAAWNTRASTPARPTREEIARLEAALRLARNRLQAHAIDSIARGDKHSFEHGEWADHATAALSARIKRGDCPFVAGPVWQDDECWTSEVQVVGGHAVVLTVHGATKAEVIARRDACLLALFDGASA